MEECTQAADSEPRLCSAESAELALTSGAPILKSRKDAPHVVVIDEKPPGEGGASAAAAGLLHPFTPRGKLTWLGREGFSSSLRLLDIAQRQSLAPLLSSPRVHDGRGQGWGGPRGGLVMTARSDRLLQDFMRTALVYPHDLELFRLDRTDHGLRLTRPDEERDAADTRLSRMEYALHVRAGVAVNGSSYSKALWSACKERAGERRACGTRGAATWLTQRVERLADVPAFVPDVDAVVVALGAASVLLPELRPFLPITCVGGHNIVFDRAERGSARISQGQSCQLEYHKDALPWPVLSGKYVVPMQVWDSSSSSSKHVLCAGATHEHGEAAELLARGPRLDVAASELLPALRGLFPPLADETAWTPVRALYGVRALARRQQEGRIPYCGRVAPQYIAGSLCPPSGVWVLTGLGSRGLIHHGILGQC